MHKKTPCVDTAFFCAVVCLASHATIALDVPGALVVGVGVAFDGDFFFGAIGALHRWCDWGQWAAVCLLAGGGAAAALDVPVALAAVIEFAVHGDLFLGAIGALLWWCDGGRRAASVGTATIGALTAFDVPVALAVLIGAAVHGDFFFGAIGALLWGRDGWDGATVLCLATGLCVAFAFVVYGDTSSACGAGVAVGLAITAADGVILLGAALWGDGTYAASIEATALTFGEVAHLCGVGAWAVGAGAAQFCWGRGIAVVGATGEGETKNGCGNEPQEGFGCRRHGGGILR